MSWLQPALSEKSTSASQEPTDFAQRHVVVERDLETEEMVTVELDGHAWVYAYPSYELLEQLYSGVETDHWMGTGRELKRRLPREVGIMWRPTLDDEIAVVWPKTSPVQRVSVE